MFKTLSKILYGCKSLSTSTILFIQARYEETLQNLKTSRLFLETAILPGMQIEPSYD